MSKERELLNRARYNLDREYCADLIDEIQELLAQPESLREDLREDLREGIYLRDHFAGLAMQGLLASPVMGDVALHGSADLWIQDMTESAYEFADAMLAERGKNEN